MKHKNTCTDEQEFQLITFLVDVAQARRAICFAPVNYFYLFLRFPQQQQHGRL